MSGTEVGVGFVRLIPSMRGFGPQAQRILTGSLDPAARRAGQTAGRTLTDGISGSMQAASQSISSAGQAMTAGLTLPLGGLGALAVSTAGNFEAAMNAVRAVTGATGQDFQSLQELAKQMGSSTQFSATEAANAMEFLGMAGLSTEQILSSLPDVLNLAAAGSLDLATAADIASNIMSGFGIEAEESARVADVLASTVTSTNTDIIQLGEAMKYTAPLASAAGWSLEETAAAIGFLGNAGIQGSMAGTGLNSILATLSDTSSTGGQRLQEFGVAAQDANGQVRPLTDVLEDLADEGADVADVIGIFGLEAGPKLQALLGQGSDGLRELTADLETADGAAKEMADIRMEGFAGSVMELKSAWEGLLIAIADAGLLEWATRATERMADFVQSLSETNPELLKWVSLIGMGVAALGPLVLILGKVVAAAGTLLSVVKSAGVGLAALGGPVGIVVAALAALAAGLVYAYQTSASLRAAVNGLVSGIGEAFSQALSAAGLSMGDLVATVQGYMAQLAGVFQLGVELLSGVWDLFGQDVVNVAVIFLEHLIDTISGLLTIVQGLFQAVTALIRGDWSLFWSGLQNVAQGAWKVIATQVTSALSLIQAAMSAALRLLREIWDRAWTAVKDVAGAAWRTIVSDTREYVGRMRDRVVSGFSRVRDAFRDLKRWITDFFSGAKDWLGAAGKRIVQGLIDGIKSKVGDVGNAVSSIASTVRSYLPFSPAKEGPLRQHPPDEAGVTIGAMLAAGLRDSVRDVATAASLAAGAAAPLPAGVGATPASALGASTAPAVVEIRADGTRAARALVEILQTAVRVEGGGDVQRYLGQGRR